MPATRLMPPTSTRRDDGPPSPPAGHHGPGCRVERGEVMPHCTSGRGSTRLWFPAVGQRWVGLSQTSCALSDRRYVAAEGEKALLSPNTSCGVTSTREGKRRRHQSALGGAVRFRPPLSVALTAVGVECQTRSPPSISLAAKHPEKIYVWQDSQGEKKSVLTCRLNAKRAESFLPRAR